jgi:hypothetical protein
LGSVYSQIGATGAGQANNGTSGAVAAGTLGVYYAFIQFAGFTMGKAISPFSAQFVNYPGNNFDGLVGGGGTVTGVNQFVYTAQFGNGVSGTLGVQDSTQYYQAGVVNFGALGSGASYSGTSDYAGTVFPDIVGNITVDQAWGVAQLSVAAHDNNPAYYNNALIQAGHPDDKWGFAVQGALTIKNIPTGAGDTINSGLGGFSWCVVDYQWWDRRIFVCPRLGIQHERSAAADLDVGWARCVQPQLESLLEFSNLRCLR